MKLFALCLMTSRLEIPKTRKFHSPRNDGKKSHYDRKRFNSMCAAHEAITKRAKLNLALNELTVNYDF